jgi:glucose-6-phosphate isomerase
MRHRERGQQESARDYDPTPIRVDHTLAMAEFVGAANGISEAQLRQLEPQLQRADEQMHSWRTAADGGWWALPYDMAAVAEVKGLAKQLKEWCRDALVVGLGDAALGIRALRQALLHPSHNYFPLGRRHYHSRLFIADSLDPDNLYGMLDGLELKRLAVNVISTSGETPETLALLAFIYQILANRLDPAQARESCVVTTTAAPSTLRRLAVQEGFPLLTVPADLPGGFGLLSVQGLFPAALAGIDINGLLAGARFMDQHLREAPLSENAAYRLAAIYYLAHGRQGRRQQLIMPCAHSLLGLAHWYSRLWSTCLEPASSQGEGHWPGRAAAAAGIAEHYRLAAARMANAAHVFVTFWEVEQFQHQITVPSPFAQGQDLAYLHGQPLARVLAAARQATAWHLAEAGCPSLTIKIPAVNAFTLGQLILLLQTTVVALGALAGIDPFARRSVDDLRQTTCGLLGRAEDAAAAQALAHLGQTKSQYVV